MKTQRLTDCLEEQKKAGFLPLAKIVKKLLAPQTKYDTNFSNALKKAFPEGSLKTIQIRVWAANKLIFFRATPENLALVEEVCRKISKKRQDEQKLLTSEKLARRLREKHGLLVSPDTLNRYARERKLTSKKNGKRNMFNPKSIKKIKRVLSEMQKRRG